MQRRVIFNNRFLPYLLILPQLAITVIFFFLPASQAVFQSFLRQDAFGLRTKFVGLENFQDVLSDPLYIDSVKVTVVFSLSVTLLVMSIGLLLALMADRKIRGGRTYKTLLLWPYALAPAVAAALWLFIFHPSVGIIGRTLNNAGVSWDYRLNGFQGLLLVVVASSWRQVAYNFLFFLAGLQSVPQALVEAAMIDGAGGWRVFRNILFPLISPTTFLMVLLNMIYSTFDTFGVIHAMTGGGPGRSTMTLMYKVYADGVISLDLGQSAAQSVILMVFVCLLAWLQFRLVERRVHYG